MLRFFSFLAGLLIVVLIIVAFARGWVNVSVFNNEEPNQSGATVTIDKNKIKEDVNAAKDKVHIGSKAEDGKHQADGKQQSKVQGKVKEVGPSELILTTDADKSLDLTIARETDIRIGNEKGSLQDIRPGDRVTASYVTLENRHVATSLRKD
jgi:hypothetical protein